MKQGDIVCWQYYDTSSYKYWWVARIYTIRYATSFPVCYWRIKSTKPTPTKGALLNK